MFASPAYAQTAGAAPPSTMAAIMSSPLPMLALMLLIFWFLMWRPQMKAQKALRNRIAGAKKGDTVVTAGGLIGKVVKVDGEEVELELGANVRVRAIKNTLTDVRPLNAPAND
jgi:preprotein translocase subunit YajC